MSPFNIDRRPLFFRDEATGRIVSDVDNPRAPTLQARLYPLRHALEVIAARPCERECRRGFPCSPCVAREALRG